MHYFNSSCNSSSRNYFHALGGTKATSTNDPIDGASGGRLASTKTYYWDVPPWATGAGAGGSQNDGLEWGQIRQVSCSSQSSVFLTKNGKVFQTGFIHGRVYHSPTLVTIPLPLKCVEISAGRHFCLGRMEGGLAVVSWGAGHFGQLGVGGSTSEGSSNPDSQVTFTPSPVIIERLLPHIIGTPIKQIAAGDWHALALTESGRVWAWGSNRSVRSGCACSFLHLGFPPPLLL